MEKLKILYVDDEQINRQLFEMNFGKKYEVLIAEETLGALELLDKNQDIKVVLSDMKMPGMNGIEFIRLAKKKYPKLKYSILTGYDISDEIQDALDQELIFQYFRKPFQKELIIAEIDRVRFFFSEK